MKVVVILSKDIFAAGKKTATPSGFAEKVRSGSKKHTVRSNYPYWQKKIAALKEQGGFLCLRQWSDKPYRSSQETIIEVPAEMVEVQPLVMKRTINGIKAYYEAEIDGINVDIEEVAKNDGLDWETFMDWFIPIFDREGKDEITFAIIHFTASRYCVCHQKSFSIE